MLSSLTGPGSKIAALREGLDASTMRVRLIAQSVANLSTPGFATVMREAEARGQEPPDSTAVLEQEMAHLASEQIRFEMTVRLLQGSYRGLRNAIRER